MRLLDPASLASARAAANSTLAGAVKIRTVTTVPGEFSDRDEITVIGECRGRVRLLKADEIPSGMRVESQASYLVTVPAGFAVDASMSLLIAGRAYNVVGVDDAPLGGEIVRRIYAERV